MDEDLLSPALLLGITACMGILPAVLVAWRFPTPRPGLLFWATWGGGAAGLGALASVRLQAGEAPPLWLAAAGGWLLLGLLTLARPGSLPLLRRLLPLLLLLALAALALDLASPRERTGESHTWAMDAAAGLS